MRNLWEIRKNNLFMYMKFWEVLGKRGSRCEKTFSKFWDFMNQLLRCCTYIFAGDSCEICSASVVKLTNLYLIPLSFIKCSFACPGVEDQNYEVAYGKWISIIIRNLVRNAQVKRDFGMSLSPNFLHRRCAHFWRIFFVAYKPHCRSLDKSNCLTSNLCEIIRFF